VSEPSVDRPICEPVALRPGATLRAERVRQGPQAPASAPFPHFHDVHEIVLFGAVRGSFVAGGRAYALRPGCVVFIPSMCQHDFALAPGAHDWILIQLDAIAGEGLARAPGLERLARPFCADPDAALRGRLQVLAEWLVGVGATDPLGPPLVEALLRAIVRSPAMEGDALEPNRRRVDRLRPAIDRLRREPASAPSAAEAAALCAMSPAYFSRRFREEIGLSWSDYVRVHRLHLASRILLEAEQGVADIAYQLGFSTPSHFTDRFRRRFGMSPRHYRRIGRAREADARGSG
jgi:AraC-like DNA-binding protein